MQNAKGDSWRLSQLRYRRPRNSLKITSYVHQRQRAVGDDRFDFDVLAEAEFKNEVPTWFQTARHLPHEALDGLDAVRPAIEGDFRFLAHFGLQTPAVADANVGRIGDDQVERSVDAIEQIGLDKAHAA